MRILELFSGTGSIGRVFSNSGWEVTSLDSDPNTEATIHENILTWDYQSVFPPGHFDVIWASPCCTNYSKARTKAKTPRDLALADSLVQRSREIIDYFNPPVWFLENPQTGLLKERPFMQGVPFADVDYCCFCDWGYRKRTRLWNNVNFETCLCPGDGLCPNMENGKHKETAQQGRRKTKNGMIGTAKSVKKLHRIPEQLCLKILEKASSLN